MKLKKYASSLLALGLCFSSTMDLSFANEGKNSEQGNNPALLGEQISEFDKMQYIAKQPVDLTRQDFTNQTNLSFKNQAAITDIDNSLNSLVDSTNGYVPAFINYSLSSYMNKPSMSVKGVNIESTNTEDVEPIFFGSCRLVNYGPIEQTLYTQAFTETVTKSTSTATTNGFSSSFEAEGKVGIPFVAEGKVKTSLTYNFSNTASNTESKSVSLTSPSQPVTVPAGKTYECKVYFEKFKINGEVELIADIKHEVFDRYSHGPITSVYNSAVSYGAPTFGFTLSPDDDEAIRKVGRGKFSIDYGTNFIVEIKDVTNPDNPKLVKRSTLDIPNNSF